MSSGVTRSAAAGRRATTAVALIALAIEVFLGSALVLGIRRSYILWPTAALVAFFLFLTARAYWRFAHGEVVAEGCGCFGDLVERTPAEAFWQDLLLMVPALLLAFLWRGRQLSPPRIRLVLAAVLTLATVFVAWKAPELPVDDLATRLRPGGEVGTLCVGSEEDGTLECLDSARVLPELAQGEHLVILADLTDEDFAARVSALNDFHFAAGVPRLWVLTAATEEEVFAFRFGHGSAFELREAPPAMLQRLYRTLPRSFLVRDGRVVETFRGIPALERWLDPDATDGRSG